MSLKSFLTRLIWICVLPLVMLAAYLAIDRVRSLQSQRDRLKSYEQGVNSFVRKPLDFAEFAEAVARLGVYWVALNLPPKG